MLYYLWGKNMRIVKEKKKIDGNKVVNRIGIGMVVVRLALLPVSITSYVNKKSNEEEPTSATKIEVVEPEIRYVDGSEVYMMPQGYSLNGKKLFLLRKFKKLSIL